jgi:nucleolin
MFGLTALGSSFGYVTFDSVEGATRAIEAMNLQTFEGRRIVVNYASHPASSLERRGKTQPTKTLFIGNMSHDMTDRDLNELFADVRNVIDVRVAVDRETGKPRGFAHADFIDIKSAEAGIEYLKNKAPYGRKLRVDFSLTNKRTTRDRQSSGSGEHSN